jgi:hypothetical protein
MSTAKNMLPAFWPSGLLEGSERMPPLSLQSTSKNARAQQIVANTIVFNLIDLYPV